MTTINFPETWSSLLGTSLVDQNYWIAHNKMPLGTLRPPEEYKSSIPIEDIVAIKYDPITAPFTTRSAMNVLILGGSGDGKSLLMKVMWSVLADAGFYIGYVDPKSTDSGRARMPWKSDRIPPFMEAKGIKLQHFMPIWATLDYGHLVHNFRLYSTKLSNLNEKAMWRGLGMTSIAASNVIRMMRRENFKVNLSDLKKMLFELLDNKELPPGSYDNIIRVLVDLEDDGILSEKTKPVNLINEWKQGFSLCFSYNNAATKNMSFDIGHKIRQSSLYYDSHNNRTPIVWFLDDSSFFAQTDKFFDYNFAIEEIKHIGFNYRSRGVYNVLAVQSLAIIDERVAEGYKIKIISPMFQNIESLSRINIPKRAMKYLREGWLKKDKETHTIQWLLIDENNNVIPFFPFTPPCNHFREIYFPKEEGGNQHDA